MRLTLVETNWLKHVLRAEAAYLVEQPLPKGTGEKRRRRQQQAALLTAVAAALERREVIEYEVD